MRRAGDEVLMEEEKNERRNLKISTFSLNKADPKEWFT
jgi:hypothetical protein